MLKTRRRLPAAAVGTLMLALTGTTALAQEGNSLGPPQLRDFQLKGERRTPPAQPQPTTPAPTPAPPAAAERAPAQPAQGQPRPAAARPAREQPPTEATRPPASGPAQAAPSVPAGPQDVFPLPAAPEAAAPPAADSAPAPSAPDEWTPFWLYAIPAGLALLAGLVLLRRRRLRGEPKPTAAEFVAEPAAPRPEPIPRPWLELELKAERAASTDAEASVEFEMVVRNTGKSTARNIRINARMFNAGREQDKEIGAFFKTKGEGRRTYTIPDLPAGERGLIQGTVTMPREEMRALKVNEQLLFIPVVGVNAVYDWGEGRSGQTSKSYVIGRELGEESDKMGAFRLDLGPRIYRTVGQRQHNLARRV